MLLSAAAAEEGDRGLLRDTAATPGCVAGEEASTSIATAPVSTASTVASAVEEADLSMSIEGSNACK